MRKSLVVHSTLLSITPKLFGFEVSNKEFAKRIDMDHRRNIAIDQLESAAKEYDHLLEKSICSKKRPIAQIASCIMSRFPICVLLLSSQAAFTACPDTNLSELKKRSVKIVVERGLICSGFRLNQKSILTAAHCLQGWTGALTITENMSKYSIKGPKIRIHPSFQANSQGLFDIAIIETSATGALNNGEPFSIAAYTTGCNAVFMGFGTREFKQISGKWLNIGDPEAHIEKILFEKMNGVLVHFQSLPDATSQFQGKSGHGDSGSVLVQGTKIVGILKGSKITRADGNLMKILFALPLDQDSMRTFIE